MRLRTANNRRRAKERRARSLRLPTVPWQVRLTAKLFDDLSMAPFVRIGGYGITAGPWLDDASYISEESVHKILERSSQREPLPEPPVDRASAPPRVAQPGKTP